MLIFDVLIQPSMLKTEVLIQQVLKESVSVMKDFM